MVREVLERVSESAREAFETVSSSTGDLVLVDDRIGRREVSVEVTKSIYITANLPGRHSRRLLQFARRHSGT